MNQILKWFTNYEYFKRNSTNLDQALTAAAYFHYGFVIDFKRC